VIENRETLELSKQVEANRGQIETFDDEISSLLAKVESKSKDLSETITERFERHPGVLSTRREVVGQRAEVEELEGSIASAVLDAEETKGFIEKTESYMDEIKNQFRVELDESLADENVYLVDFSGRQFRAFKVYNGEQSKVESSSAQELLQKVKADTEERRVFFFVRPDAVSEFNKTLIAFRESNIAVGYQPVPAGEKLILTKFPAGVPAVDVATPGSSGATSGGQTGSGGVAGSNSTGGGPLAPGEAGGEGSGSEAQRENQASPSGTASDSGGGADASSGEGQEQPSGDADSQAEGTIDPDQAGQEPSSEDDQTFNWLLLMFLLFFLIVLALTIKGSKR